MATTEILPFCTNAVGAGGNRLSPAAYAALTTLLANGYQAGVALSAQMNTTYAQSSLMAAGLANFMVAQGVSQPDDGNAAACATNIASALTAFVGSLAVASKFYTGASTAGSANAQTLATVSPTGLTLTNGVTVVCTAGYSNSGAATFNANGTGAVAIRKNGGSGLTALVGGEIVAGNVIVLSYQTAGNFWVLSDPYFNTAFGTAAYLNVGTGNNQVVQLNGSAQLPAVSGALLTNLPVVFTKSFTSADQTITAGGALTLPHSLGTAPVILMPFLKCVTADVGYSVGDITPVNGNFNGDDSNGRGQAMTFDATNIYVRFGITAGSYHLVNKTTGGAGVAITNSSWNFIVKAYA